MSKITTKEGRTVFKDAESMLVMPYVYDSTEKDYILGSDIYDISAVIGDSIVIEQSEGDTKTKDNEFTSVPLLVNVSGGKYNFTAQCLDMQESVLRALFNASTANDGRGGIVEGVAAFQSDIEPLFALIRLRFADRNLPDVIMPKVQLNSRLFIQQLHTRAGQGNIAGTALDYTVCIEDKDNMGHLLQFTNPTTYVPSSPVIFVPRDYRALFAKTKGSSKFYEVNFDTGVKTAVDVNSVYGTWVVSNV